MPRATGFFLAVVIGSFAPSGVAAEESATTIVLTSTCPATVIDADELRAALRIELQSTLGHPVTITQGDAVMPSYTIDVACTTNEALVLTLTRAQPPGEEQQRISVSDIEVAARPRAIALAIAEGVRAVRTRRASSATTAIRFDSATSVATPPATQSDDHAKRRRLLGGLAIGFGALTVASAVVGGSLLAAGNRDPSNTIPGLTIPGTTLLAIGGAALVGAGVTFGLWLRQRRR